MAWTASEGWRKRRYEKFRALLNEHKTKPCADCNVEYPPVVMDFDHVRGVKKFNIGMAVNHGIETLLAEIAKCEVVCSNCHRLRTAYRRSAPAT